ncbi:unnamed protein product [Musa hybrid cultivar]
MTSFTPACLSTTSFGSFDRSGRRVCPAPAPRSLVSSPRRHLELCVPAGRSLFGDAVYLTLATRVGGGGGDKFESLKLERKHPWRPHKTSERLHPKIPLILHMLFIQNWHGCLTC